MPGFVQGIVKGQISKATEDALKRFKEEAERVPLTNGGKGAPPAAATELAPNAGVRGRLQAAGALLAFAGLRFLMLITVLESIYPNYSVHTNTISDLLAIGTRTSLIGEPLAFIVAVSWIGGAYYLFRKSGRRRLMALNLLPGTGLLLAVVSPENVNIAIHSAGAVIAFIPGPIVAMLSYRMIKSPFRYFAWPWGPSACSGPHGVWGVRDRLLSTDPRSRRMGEGDRLPAPHLAGGLRRSAARRAWGGIALRAGPLLLQVTSAVLGLQLLLGGLLTFGFISSEAHIAVGFALFILSVATMAAWLASKPSFRPMKVVTAVIVVLILLQIVLGEATLNNGSQAIAFLHFVNAMAIFGAMISGAFMAMRWEQVTRATKAPEEKAQGS